MLAQHGITSPTGSVADSHNNPLAEAVYGLYKTESTYPRTWAGLTDKEYATIHWTHWTNNARLHQPLRHRTVSEVMNAYNQTRTKALAPFNKRHKTQEASVLHERNIM